MFVVAGATGHVGSVVARELLGHGQKVKVLVRDAAKGAPWAKLGAEIAVGSLEDSKSLAGALRGALGFFTLLPPELRVTGFYAHQRKTADAIAAAVKESKVPHVVQLSSIGADLPDGTGPIKGLHHLENALRAAGVKLTAIRAGYFQENVASSLGPAKSSGVFPNMLPSADAPFPMIATRDIGLLAACELELPSTRSEVVDLQGPSYSIRQAAEMLGKALGKKLQVVDIPPQGQVAAMVQAGMSQEIAEVMAEMNAGFASGRIRPIGDRMKLGRTPLEAVLSGIVSSTSV